MKNRQWITAFLSLLFLFAMTGCSHPDQETHSLMQELLPEDTEQLTVCYLYAGETTEWELNSEEIEELQAWVKALSLNPVTFEKGNTPTDSDGGSAYDFQINHGETAFSYLLSGEKHYILWKDQWYEVLNPSDPPVENKEIPTPKESVQGFLF